MVLGMSSTRVPVKMVKYEGPFRDSEGTLIEVGDEVAFNRSGDVLRGFVTRIGSVLVREDTVIDGELRSAYTKPCDIRIDHPDADKLSRVKNALGILVLRKVDE